MTQEQTATRTSLTTTLPTVGNKKQRQFKVTTVMNFTIMAKPRPDFIHHLVFPWQTALKNWAVLDHLHYLSVCQYVESIKGAEFCIILSAIRVFSIPFALSAIMSQQEISSYDNILFA